MGDATIVASNWRLVEVGRVILLQGNGPYAGRLATIVEIIDHKRTKSSPFPDKLSPLADALLAPFVIEKLPRAARTGTVKKFWEEAQIDAKWKESSWAKRKEQNERRRALTDFDRFKVMRLKKQRRFEQRKALVKVKASA
ncbi:60S ribosomal protein eL14 [Apiospora kogelbergensis]|uniref:60S ribosomal protein eL14 n=1 Tax=Apiospora kogelbergensis TaxID=1337665 RepID=UPI00313029D2